MANETGTETEKEREREMCRDACYPRIDKVLAENENNNSHRIESRPNPNLNSTRDAFRFSLCLFSFPSVSPDRLSQEPAGRAQRELHVLATRTPYGVTTLNVRPPRVYVPHVLSPPLLRDTSVARFFLRVRLTSLACRPLNL